MTYRSFSTAFCLLCAVAAQAKVATISLDELARSSPMILVAEVKRIEVSAGVRIAYVTPLQSIRGISTRQIAFVAERTWTCDTSAAVKGERVLLYLSPIRVTSQASMNGQDLGKAKAACAKDGVELYVLSHSGRGRIKLHEVGGRWFAPITNGEGRGPSLNVNLYLPWSKSEGPLPSIKPGISASSLIKRTIAVLN